MALCVSLLGAHDPPLISRLALHDALPICSSSSAGRRERSSSRRRRASSPPTTTSSCSRSSRRRRREEREQLEVVRSEEHTSELQSLRHLVCRLLLEKKKWNRENTSTDLDP